MVSSSTVSVYCVFYIFIEMPTTEILFHQPHLIHRVKGDFGADTGVSMSLYKNRKFDWRHLDIIHLLMNHRSYNELFVITYQYEIYHFFLMECKSCFDELLLQWTRNTTRRPSLTRTTFAPMLSIHLETWSASSSTCRLLLLLVHNYLYTVIGFQMKKKVNCLIKL
jgi:hypothetical protein